MYMHIWSAFSLLIIYIYVCMYTYIYTHACVYVCIRAILHIIHSPHIHIHTHTYSTRSAPVFFNLHPHSSRIKSFLPLLTVIHIQTYTYTYIQYAISTSVFQLASSFITDKVVPAATNTSLVVANTKKNVVVKYDAARQGAARRVCVCVCT